VFHRRDLNQVPDLLALHQHSPEVYPYLLASNTSGSVNARYSLLLAHPSQTRLQLDQADILAQLEVELAANTVSTDLPFVGGWFVYLGYEYAANIEPGVEFFGADVGLPNAVLCRISAAVIIDHEVGTACIVSDAEHGELIEQIEGDIHSCKDFDSKPIGNAQIAEEDPDIYRGYLDRTHRYIVDGDIFQANLSRLWRASFDGPCDGPSLFHRLSLANPAPFAALALIGDSYILSSSPERLVSVDDGVIETRPIAGTHPRGRTEDEDRSLSDILIRHPKERAEHVMLIDLERNDLGRICQPGSIHVDDNMIVESYQHVHHIVSSIRGRLQPGTSVQDVVHAVFPGGTITGCPKVRCMQIISELEQAPRGAYTGSLGYISDHGRIDLNILIRTMTLRGKQLSFRAGAGIVHDSKTEKELNETRYKARGMLNALSSDL
jgi:anthranilate synthase component 1